MPSPASSPVLGVATVTSPSIGQATTVKSTSLPGPFSRFEPERTALEEKWIAVAREVSRELSLTAAERYRVKARPFAEQDLLRDSGLATLLVPAEFGGGGGSWHLAADVVREVSAGDASLGVLLVHHTFGIAGITGRPEAERARLYRDTVEKRWWYGVIVNPRDPDITATPIGNGRFLLNGRKTFCTGASLADRLSIHVKRTDTGKAHFAHVEATRAGIKPLHDWDSIGLPLAESGSFVLNNVEISESELTPTGFGPREFTGRHSINAGHLLFNAVYLGIALGALRAARSYIQTTTRPWEAAKVDRASEDPYIIHQFGELWAQWEAAANLADQATLRAEKAQQLPVDQIDETVRGQAQIAIATAKVLGAKVSVDITSTIFELMGARSTAASYGFDRFWRDARTYTLHHPLAYKVREVGDYALNDRFPVQSYYS